MCLPEELHRPRRVGLERGASRKRSIEAFLDVPLVGGLARSGVPDRPAPARNT
jgi:hypothetical protein